MEPITSVKETITAVATPPGRGGVGIVRVSGPMVTTIAEAIVGEVPQVRLASYADFKSVDDDIIDQGIALYFKAPHSFTGEDVLELQGHGGPVVMDQLLQRVLSLGARLARPGEFSERAFLNDKIDLVQAEAIADLIDASSTKAASSAIKSLTGEFSTRINTLVEQIIQCRMYVEAAIDFPEEEIDFLQDQQIQQQLTTIQQQITQIQQSAKQGVILRDGIHVVIAGKPNAGKSSLLNALSGNNRAIVTDIPGTTRDVLREYIHIDGIPLHITDTAGLRTTEDKVEQEGVRRAQQEIEQADCVLYIIDATDEHEDKSWQQLKAKNTLFIYNKIDLTRHKAEVKNANKGTEIYLSAKHQQGLELLTQQLKQLIAYQETDDSVVIARRRHVDAIESASAHVQHAYKHLNNSAGELLAEELRQAQLALCQITGEFSSDDLLGRIFSEFCIGK